MAEVLTRIDEQVARAGDLLDWLVAVQADPCYAAAHARYIEYYAWMVDAFTSTRPMFEAATTVFDMLPAVLALDTEGRSRFPDAYIVDPGAQSGFRSSPINILDTLATCEGAVTPAPAPTPTTSLTITKVAGGEIEQPEGRLPPGEYEMTRETTCGGVGITLQGVELLDTADHGHSGSRRVTIEPQTGIVISGGSWWSCDEEATLVVTITPVE